MITAIEFLRRDESGVYSEQDIVHAMIEFAKLHSKAQTKAINDNVSLRQSSSEEVNDNNIYPFVTAYDSTVWVIDKEKILNAYPLENIK